MSNQETITAETLELLLMNQTCIRAALEELSLWVSYRGSIHTHENVMVTLASLDVNSEAILSGIDRLRSAKDGTI